MHELSIVRSMLSLCEEYAQGKRVKKVVARIGRMGGVEPHFLKQSFDLFKEETLCGDAELEIFVTDVRIRCDECGKEATVEGYDFHCPFCGSGATRLVSGREMQIDYIEVEECA
ncbi:hydrogenase maturation nickel metallochaperone HypA/HybF [Hydrogenimonas sp.]